MIKCRGRLVGIQPRISTLVSGQWYHRECNDISFWNSTTPLANVRVLVHMFSGPRSKGKLPWYTDHFCNMLHKLTCHVSSFSEIPSRWSGSNVKYFYRFDGQYLFLRKQARLSRAPFGVCGSDEKFYGGVVVRGRSSSRDFHSYMFKYACIEQDISNECQQFFLKSWIKLRCTPYPHTPHI